MKLKINILLILFFLFVNIVFAQDSKFFYVEIPNKNYVPAITHHKNGVRKSYSKTTNNTLNKLLNSYMVYNCRKVFTKSKKYSLQNIYLIECNDLKLMNDLLKNFKEVYPRVEKADAEILSIPNDYGIIGGYTGTDQDELDFIRAPEAWDITTGSNNIIIGVSDTNFEPNHEDLIGTLDITVNESSNNLNGNQHGSKVAGYAAANTNNNKGISAIGYDSHIYAGVGLNASVLDELSSFNEVKVVNASWGSSSASPPTITPPIYEEIINDRNVVVVAAAGNGNYFTSTASTTDYWFPASYKDVISVSSIGHKSKNWWWQSESFTDRHEVLVNGEVRSFQHNDSIDIVAPGYAMVSVNPGNGTGLSAYYDTKSGTSFSAPIVAGTVALMFDANYCIDPKEVETILKLTAVKIDTLPQNIQYYGKLGAGKLDAYEAVKMAKDMADAFGTVEVKDRVLYRWFYKLETAPYEIKMTNNDVTGNARLKFKARNNIEILSGDYYPSTGGYIDLAIDSMLVLDCPPPPIFNNNSSKKAKTKINSTLENIIENKEILVFPNPTKGIINIINKEDLKEVFITDITGKVFYYNNNINTKEILIDMSKFNSGIYFLKTKVNTGEGSIKKIIKK